MSRRKEKKNAGTDATDLPEPQIDVGAENRAKDAITGESAAVLPTTPSEPRESLDVDEPSAPDLRLVRGSTPGIDPLIGLVIDGRYEIVGYVGRGAMGVVYKAEQRRLGREVAIKLLDPLDDAQTGPDAPESNFLKEASVLATLEHPHSVRIFDFGEWQGRTYVAMEFLRGQTLGQLLVAGAMKPQRVLHIVRQAVGALREAHSLDVVHRDLKPANLMICPQPGDVDFVKVIDYGLARKTDAETNALTDTDFTMGTPGYMAPETVRGTAQDSRVDIYAIGVILYEALTGKAPFNRKMETQTLLLEHLHGVPPTFAERNPDVRVHKALEWTTRTCLQKDPALRFRTAGELDRALQACQVALDVPGMTVELDIKEGRTILPAHLRDAGTGSVRVVGAGYDASGTLSMVNQATDRTRWGWLVLALLALLLLAAYMFTQRPGFPDSSVDAAAPGGDAPPTIGAPANPAASDAAPAGAAVPPGSEQPVAGVPEQRQGSEPGAAPVPSQPAATPAAVTTTPRPAPQPVVAKPRPKPRPRPAASSAPAPKPPPAAEATPAPAEEPEAQDETPEPTPTQGIDVKRDDLKNPFDNK